MSLLLLGACSKEDTDLVEEQQGKIVKFLTSSHVPKLIAESDIAESLESNPEFYTISGQRVYRYIADYYNSDRAEKEEVERGDAITLTFWCYDFSKYSAPTGSNLFYTNDIAYKDALVDAGLNIEYWNFEPQRIVLGSGDILKSIENALIGCREGDKVELYLTYNMAYGSNWIGVTALNEPMAFFCTIESIEN